MKMIGEGAARTIDASCKVVGTLGIVIGGLLGLSNYLSSREHELYVRQAEAAKPALEERLKLCVDLTSASGKVATATDPKERAIAQTEFEQIYWGPFGLVESGDASEAAEHMETCVEDSSKCEPNAQLLSRRLALMCRTSVGPEWGYPPVPKAENLKVEVH